jgi:hypothetical protein
MQKFKLFGRRFNWRSIEKFINSECWHKDEDYWDCDEWNNSKNIRSNFKANGTLNKKLWKQLIFNKNNKNSWNNCL